MRYSSRGVSSSDDDMVNDVSADIGQEQLSACIGGVSEGSWRSFDEARGSLNERGLYFHRWA